MNLMEEYGKATVALEIAQNRHQELKRQIVAEMNKKPEAPKEEEKAA